MDEQDKPIPSLGVLRMQIPLQIRAIPIPLHEGIALVLESKQFGVTQWALSKEESRQLVRILNECLDDLKP